MQVLTVGRMGSRIGVLALACLVMGALSGCPDDGTPGGDSGFFAELPEQSDVGVPDTGEPDAGVDDSAQPDAIEPVDRPLTIFSVSPNQGAAAGLEQVEIVGQGFHGGLALSFGESPALDMFVLDSEHIIALTPARQPGLVDVSLIDADTGASSVLESGFLFFNEVSIVSVDPPMGDRLGGEAITVIGTGFSADSQILIGGRAAISVEVIDDNHLLATTPDALKAGVVDVHISNNRGVGVLKDGFTYTAPPIVTGVVPPTGLVDGGTMVEVRGTGFTEPMAVLFGGVALTELEVLSSDRVVGRVPAAAMGPVEVFVTTTYGAAARPQGYTYLNAPTADDALAVIAVTPPSGPTSGGGIATLVVTGLTTAPDTSVTIGGKIAAIKGFDGAAQTVLVQVPPGAAGSAELVVTNAKGAATFADGYLYESFMKIYEVQPNFGPVEGGTAVVISGVGFEPGLQLRIGALPASEVVVVDGATITAVTPPGSPGYANITVLQGAQSDTLNGAFAYQAEMGLWVVEPSAGSIAGGTQIILSGSGFPADATVQIGGVSATHVEVLSPTQIRAKTPPGPIGSADVTVDSAAKGTVQLPLAYTYFNPGSSFGGTWGSGVDGVVNVSVIDGATGAGIPEAFVMMWTDPATPYQGFTNQAGQITFSGPELAGDQMVSASKDGYASQSVVEYDAENITLFMSPTSPPSPGGPPPGFVQPIFRGTVANLTKYVPVPWGQCYSKTEAPGLLCEPCTSNAECGTLNCSNIPNQGKFCTSHCVNTTDCADGFMCVPLAGVAEAQCVPASGTVVSYCDFTKPTIFSEDYILPPGQKVNPDNTFEMAIPVGEVAVFCWGGVEDDFGNFTAHALGLRRHLVPQPGDIFEETIWLAHPLTSPMTIRLDDPPNNVNGPNFNYAAIHLDLGSDGTLEFLEHPFAFGSPELLVENMPKALTGDIYDASYTFFAGAFSSTEDNLPYSVTLHHDISNVEDDTMYVFEGAGWEPQATGVTKNINAMTGATGKGLIGVGSDGWIIQRAGSGWGGAESGVKGHLKAVHGVPSGDAIAVGEDGDVTHYDGLTWTPQDALSGSDFEGVWMASPTDAFAVGFYQVRRWDGVKWSSMTGNTSKNLRAVWGFGSDDVWAVGNYGQMIRFDGAVWNNVTTGTSTSLRSVWGAAPDDLWIVGEAGLIIHWDGTELTPMDSGTTRTLESVWGTGANDVYIVGERGTILHWDGVSWTAEGPKDYDATFLTIAGMDGAIVASGTHELLLGPMLEVPENITPTQDGVMGEDYEISWTVQEGVEPHFSFVEVAVPGLMGPTPEWTIINDFHVTSIDLPDFPSIEGTPGIGPGSKILTIVRAYREGFDINNYSVSDLNQSTWRSWAMDRLTFTKL